MPGTSLILPFDTANSNLLTDGEYADDPDRISGHQAGTVARSQLVNKQAKQASYMAAVLAQFIAERQDNSVSDLLSVELGVSAMAAAFTGGTIPAASTTGAGVVELATNTETQNGVAVDGKPNLVVTPVGLKSVVATEGRRGLIALASEAEVTELVPDQATKAVTPATLGARTSSTTRKGLVELATDAETEAGADVERAVTPHGLTAALAAIFDVSASLPGYIKLPGGIVFQWGTYESTGDPAVVFPLEFPTACFGVHLTPEGAMGGAPGPTLITTTGFTPDTGEGGHTVYWLAVGH